MGGNEKYWELNDEYLSGEWAVLIVKQGRLAVRMMNVSDRESIMIKLNY